MRKLIIRLLPSSEQVEWLIIDASDKLVHGPVVGTLSECVQAKNHTVIVIINGIDVLVTDVTIPQRLSNSRLSSVIPFALEDRLGESLDKLHYAWNTWNKRRADGTIPVAVINHADMKKWIGLLKDAEINPSELIPEQLALPYLKNTWNVLVDKNRIIVRTATQSGFVVDKNNFYQLLAWKLDECSDTQPEQIQIINDPDKKLLTEDQLNTLKPRVIFVNDQKKALEFFAEGLTKGTQSEQTINLLQGKYATQQDYIIKNLSIKKIGLVVAGLSILWLSLLGIGTISQYFYYKNQNVKLTEQIASLYHKVYPKARQITTPKLRIGQDLKRLGASRSTGNFITLLIDVAKDLHFSPTTKIESINFQNDRLTLQAQFDSFKQLEVLTKKWSANGLQVKKDQAATKNNRVHAFLSINRNNE